MSIIKMDLNSKTFNCFQRWLRIHGYGLVLSSIILFIFRIFITFLTINMAENIFLAELPLFYWTPLFYISIKYDSQITFNSTAEYVHWHLLYTSWNAASAPTQVETLSYLRLWYSSHDHCGWFYVMLFMDSMLFFWLCEKFCVIKFHVRKIHSVISTHNVKIQSCIISLSFGLRHRLSYYHY